MTAPALPLGTRVRIVAGAFSGLTGVIHEGPFPGNTVDGPGARYIAQVSNERSTRLAHFYDDELEAIEGDEDES